MSQNEDYKHTSRIDYIGGLIGADRARDVLKVAIQTADEPVEVTGETLGADQSTLFEEFLAGTDTHTERLSSEGAERLVGRVKVAHEYQVEVAYLDEPHGNTLFTDVLATAPAGTVTSINEQVVSPHLEVTIENLDSSDTEMMGSLYLR